ncbi:MAG: shikimate kinase [Bradymonadales bacterium]|nr:shikimate kinase [Bradymonadales bacterium]
MSNLVLVGVRGAGKSAVGELVATRLGLTFVDLDREVERLAGRTVAEIFGGSQEATFRRLESEVLRQAQRLSRSVVATGGGVVTSGENREILGGLGMVVWLQVTPEQAIARLTGSSDRPPLTHLPPLEEARRIARLREPWYREVAHHAVSTDHRTLAEICDELEQLWRAFSGDHLR